MNFIQNINTDYPLNAFNDAVVEFTEVNSVKAKIEVSGFDAFEISGLNGYYYFNFKEIFKVIINQNLFADSQTIVNGFNADSSLFKKVNVIFKTFDELNNILDTKTFAYKFKKSVVQIEDDTNQQLILHDEFEGIYNFDVYINLPFDFTIYKQDYQMLYFNGINFPNSQAEGIYRVGIINELGDFLNGFSFNGNNDLILQQSNGNNAKAKVHVHNKCSGIYLKWLNVYGGWDYFLFTDKFKITPTDKSLGEVYTGFNNIQNLSTFASQLGKDVSVKYSIIQEYLNDWQFKKVSKMIFSPKVYMWTGKKWIEVNIDSKLKYGSKIQKGKFEFDLTLPQRQTQSI